MKVRRPVAWELVRKDRRGRYRNNDRSELVEFRQAR
jgi:hypothetical protein